MPGALRRRPRESSAQVAVSTDLMTCLARLFEFQSRPIRAACRRCDIRIVSMPRRVTSLAQPIVCATAQQAMTYTRSISPRNPHAQIAALAPHPASEPSSGAALARTPCRKMSQVRGARATPIVTFAELLRVRLTRTGITRADGREVNVDSPADHSFPCVKQCLG
jgi:hypothetical protein